MLTARVAAIARVADDVLQFTLRAEDESPLPEFIPGSHVDIHLEDDIVRQYSLTNGPRERDCYKIAVKLEPQSRGGSRAMHADLKVGNVVRMSAPRNAFALSSEADHHVFLAGGIGVTPILSMARHLAEDQTSFELHFFYRAPEFAPFLEELLAAPFASRVHVHEGLDAAGVRYVLAGVLDVRPGAAHVYFCGPPPFMEAVNERARSAWPPSATHFELFAPQTFAGDANGSFTVELSKSGGSFIVNPNETIIDVLGRAGVEFAVSCEVGICGTCVTAVLAGIPDHRDQILTASEHESVMTICCSRSLTPTLVLDL